MQQKHHCWKDHRNIKKATEKVKKPNPKKTFTQNFHTKSKNSHKLVCHLVSGARLLSEGC